MLPVNDVKMGTNRLPFERISWIRGKAGRELVIYRVRRFHKKSEYATPPVKDFTTNSAAVKINPCHSPQLQCHHLSILLGPFLKRRTRKFCRDERPDSENRQPSRSRRVTIFREFRFDIYVRLTRTVTECTWICDKHED
jgi:hypothetical protein